MRRAVVLVGLLVVVLSSASPARASARTEPSQAQFAAFPCFGPPQIRVACQILDKGRKLIAGGGKQAVKKGVSKAGKKVTKAQKKALRRSVKFASKRVAALKKVTRRFKHCARRKKCRDVMIGSGSFGCFVAVVSSVIGGTTNPFVLGGQCAVGAGSVIPGAVSAYRLGKKRR